MCALSTAAPTLSPYHQEREVGTEKGLLGSRREAWSRSPRPLTFKKVNELLL